MSRDTTGTDADTPAAPRPDGTPIVRPGSHLPFPLGRLALAAARAVASVPGQPCGRAGTKRRPVEDGSLARILSMPRSLTRGGVISRHGTSVRYRFFIASISLRMSARRAAGSKTSTSAPYCSKKR